MAAGGQVGQGLDLGFQSFLNLLPQAGQARLQQAVDVQGYAEPAAVPAGELAVGVGVLFRLIRLKRTS